MGYMGSNVILGWETTRKSDLLPFTFSYGILMWSVLSSQEPYHSKSFFALLSACPRFHMYSFPGRPDRKETTWLFLLYCKATLTTSCKSDSTLCSEGSSSSYLIVLFIASLPCLPKSFSHAIKTWLSEVAFMLPNLSNNERKKADTLDLAEQGYLGLRSTKI